MVMMLVMLLANPLLPGMKRETASTTIYGRIESNISRKIVRLGLSRVRIKVVGTGKIIRGGFDYKVTSR